MTRFDPTKIPTSITTYEQLIIWASEIMTASYPDLKFTQSLDENGLPQKTRNVEGNSFFFTPTDPGKWYYACSAFIPLDTTYKQSGFVWDHAASLGDASPPVTMLKTS